MPEAKYAYQHDVNAGKLDEEIREASFGESKYDGLSVSAGDPDDVVVYTTDELTAAELAELDAVLAAHDPDAKPVDAILAEASVFGAEVVERWHRKFVAAGMHDAPDENLAVATALARWNTLAALGNLHAVDSDAATVQGQATFLTDDHIKAIRNEIRAYLGLDPV